MRVGKSFEANVKNSYTNSIYIGVSLLFLSCLVSCSGASFSPLATTAAQTSPGSYSIPPKLDFLLVLDDMGSAYESYSNVNSQVTQFLTQLTQQNWDYRFATIPLTTFRAISQVIGSQYDPNQASAWVAPYPGALASNVEGLLSSVFRLPSNYTDIISLSSISSVKNAQELGFKNLLKTLSTDTNFLRKDAQLVVLLQSNGDDTDLNYCIRGSDRLTVPCEELGDPVCISTAQDPIRGGSATCSANQTSLNYYRSQFQNIRSTMQFYAFVAASPSSNCVGGIATAGTRYMTMATALNGASYDLCSVPMTQVLTDLTGKLTATAGNYHTRYLILAQQPNPSTIVVTRYPGGNTSQAVTVPPSATNGWTYVGYQKNVNAIYTDTPTGTEFDMDQVTGYAIELHGTGELVGSDTGSVQYTPAGVTQSAGN